MPIVHGFVAQMLEIMFGSCTSSISLRSSHFFFSFSIRSSKKRLETISQNSPVKPYENTDDDSPLDENHISDEAMAQDLDEIEAAAYIKMREELDSLNKANEAYHKSHASIESGILFTEVGIRRYEASANDFQVCKLHHL